MNQPCSDLATHQAGSTHVAMLLPATAEPPEPTRHINFFKALLLHWPMPKRFGPHLATGSWKAAIGAHALAILVFACAWLPNAIRLGHELARGSTIRERAAEIVVRLAWNAVVSARYRENVVMVLLALPCLELGVVLLAILIMPWHAGGDRTGSVFKRSLKSVYWATTWFIPIGLLIGCFNLAHPDFEYWLGMNNDYLGATLVLVLGALPAVLLARTLLVGGTRYVGPADGPAFSPREPRCDQCGYLLVGLPLEVRCPECGMSVQGSLPGGRRHLTAWQIHEFKPHALWELLRLQRKVLTRRDLWETLPVHEGLSAARHFWWATWCLMVLLPLVVLRIISMVRTETRSVAGIAPFDLIIIAIAALTAPLLLQSLVMFAACLWGQIRYGIRDYRISAVVCYYASPLMWPAYLLLMCAFLPMDGELNAWLRSQWWLGAIPPLSHQAMAGLIMVAISLIGVLFWWTRLTHALYRVRFANV